MYNRLLLFSLVILVENCYPQTIHHANMFRGNATHDGYTSSFNNVVYDTRAWQFDAAAAIRATPLVDNDAVYFGTAKGEFFAVDKKMAQLKWKYSTGRAIHSSAACQDGKIYFSDNGQTLYCLKQASGQLIWKLKLGEKLNYPWRFDYYYSSPVLHEGKVYIGSDDGNLYVVNAADGRLLWKFRTTGLVRCTPAISKNRIYFGDTEGNFYCVDMKGRQLWNYTIIGHTANLDSFGFDRRAILAAPVITHDKIIFGARDGYLYCLNESNGSLLWTDNHVISWIISTVAVSDTFVVTGTSDKAFIKAVSLNTGNEIWKYQGVQAIWSSPLIDNDYVYEGCFDGQLLCVSLRTGKLVTRFFTNGIILSSPVIDGGLLYIGSDDGHLYALKGHAPVQKTSVEEYVYYDSKKVNVAARNGVDVRIRNYLRNNGFKIINTDSMINVMSSASAQGKVIVFATDVFIPAITDNNENSLLRQFLDKGGRIVLLANNPLFFKVDEAAQNTMGLAERKIDSVLSIDYGPTDTRAFGGLFPAFANEKGKFYGLPDKWVSTFGIDPSKIDIVLGENENGQASAFVKKYRNGGELVQIYIPADLPVNLDGIIRVAEWKF